MNKIIRMLAFVLLFLLAGCNLQRPSDKAALRDTVISPDGDIELAFELLGDAPYYEVRFRGRPVMRPSRLGFALVDAPPLGENMELIAVERSRYDQTWEQPWGEVQFIREQYNEMRVYLQEKSEPYRQLILEFRVFDDGLGFRYEIPLQPALAEFAIADELTEFAFAADHQAWWIPAYRENRYEYLYQKSPLSELNKVHTPLTLETADGLYLSLHEAALMDYAAMTLASDGATTLKADLVPWRSDGVKVYADSPLITPWRTLQIAETPGDLITSYLILNLNQPNALGDVSWVQPGKYIGIWWSIHLGEHTWGSGTMHGATTARTREYIDFAAENGLDGVLVEGWNIGWDGAWYNSMDAFSFTEPYPDFDLEEVAAYARERGVRLIGHHETGGDVRNYERQMEAAFALYESLGVDTLKTGYASVLIDGQEWHHGQHMVTHHQQVAELAAQYHIMLNVHEPVKDTGLRRTYPNLLTREGGRGMEYNAWSADGGNPPEHTTILPFTRLLSGPMDYTPGIFNLEYEGRYPQNHARSTLANQLALYVVVYSPLQMAADTPENYAAHPAFQFIRDVPVDWRETRVLNGEIGEYVTIARQDRHSDDWYIGAVTDENGRTLEVRLDFLEADKTYLAEIYADGEAAHYEDNPQSYILRAEPVTQNSALALILSPGGGCAIRLTPIVEESLVKVIPIEGVLTDPLAELSGLAWYGDQLILLPQYPDRFPTDSGASLFSISNDAIVAYLDGDSSAVIEPQPIAFEAPNFAQSISGFEGFEAIAFAGERAFLTVEASPGDAMMGYLVAGKMAADGSALHISGDVLSEIQPQAALENFSDETLIVQGDRVITLYEANGANVNPQPLAHLFDERLQPAGRLPFPNIEYRITDATAPDAEGRFWVINYFFPGEIFKLDPAADQLAAQYGLGFSHAQSPIVERLVEFQITAGGIIRTDTPPILLQLMEDGSARNWEGIVRLDKRGFLLVTDKYPETILAFVPLP